MRVCLRLLGLDILDLELTTDTASTDPGDCTTYPVGFTRPEPTYEVDMPDRGWVE